METNLSVARPRPPPELGLISAKKTSVKRSLSPSDQSGAAMPGGVKRKSTDPALLLVQSEGFSLSELDSQYRLIVEQQARRDSDLTPTFEPSGASSLSSSQCEELTHHSSSYTSWTKPVQVSLSSTHCSYGSSTLSRAGETRTAAVPTAPSWTSSPSRRGPLRPQSPSQSPASV